MRSDGWGKLRGMRFWSLGLLALCLSGCHVYHYVVAEHNAPLFDGPRGERVVARLPRYHHGRLAEEPRGARVAVEYRGKSGWVPRGSLRVFRYLDPELDGGDEQQEEVRFQLRELQLEELGRDWDPGILEAIRADQVYAGFTRPQVELAWGWPHTVERISGRERWIYRHRGERSVREWSDRWDWQFRFSFYYDPWIAPYSAFRHGYHAWSSAYPSWGWVTVQVPVTVERRVEFDEQGRVVSVDSRRILDED